MVCPEFRHLQQGVEQVDSYIFNPHKWLLLHFDCTCLFLKDTAAVTDALTVRPYYLRYHEHDQGLVEDFSDYQVSLGRRFRSLKVWFTLRSYGESGLQQYVRNHYRLINRLEAAFRADRRFEILNPVHLPLICFRLTPAVCIASVKNRHWVAETVGDGNITTTTIASSSQENGSSSSGDNGPFPFEPLGIGFRSAAEVAEELVDGINVGRKEGGGGPVLTPEAIRITNERNLQLFNIINQSGIFISKADIHGQVILRVCIGTFNSTDETTDFSWNVIRQSADKLLMASS
ncbi:hypothetical protein H4R33_006945 [Dimargaris cristalligena]|nr:hypothetical protein H4R33_006945 [Dimargaris cristalligena]